MLCLLASKTASEDAVFLVLWVLPQLYYIFAKDSQDLHRRFKSFYYSMGRRDSGR